MFVHGKPFQPSLKIFRKVKRLSWLYLKMLDMTREAFQGQTLQLILPLSSEEKSFQTLTICFNVLGFVLWSLAFPQNKLECFQARLILLVMYDPSINEL